MAAEKDKKCQRRLTEREIDLWPTPEEEKEASRIGETLKGEGEHIRGVSLLQAT